MCVRCGRDCGNRAQLSAFADLACEVHIIKRTKPAADDEDDTPTEASAHEDDEEPAAECTHGTADDHMMRSVMDFMGTPQGQRMLMGFLGGGAGNK